MTLLKGFEKNSPKVVWRKNFEKECNMKSQVTKSAGKKHKVSETFRRKRKK
jgi:hypothetical protein